MQFKSLPSCPKMFCAFLPALQWRKKGQAEGHMANFSVKYGLSQFIKGSGGEERERERTGKSLRRGGKVNFGAIQIGVHCMVATSIVSLCAV